MTELTERDYRDILDTVHALNCCEDRKSFLDTLMPSMVNMFHTDCITFHLIQGFPWHIKVVESRSFKAVRHSLDEDKFYPELYAENYFHQSPLLKEAVSSSKLILKVGESISLQDWEHSEMYNRFILPQNLYWELFLSLRWKNKLEGMITLWRSKDGGDYEIRDVLKAGLLAPHLMAASRNVSASERLAQQKSLDLDGQSPGAEGLLLLDHRLKPLYFNSRARQICLQIRNCSHTDNPNRMDSEFAIPDCIIQDCSGLLNTLKTEERPVLWPKERIYLSDGGQKFRLECSLIWKADRFNAQPNFIVILNDEPDGPAGSLTTQVKYKLSNREMDIIFYLNQGLSYEELADRLFISKQTVHTHVKNIYRKLGARSRIELYRYFQSPMRLK
jgi:DNA-binding CsgD family transcriptional regulator